MSNEDKLASIKVIVRESVIKIRALQGDSGSFAKPVGADLIKTEKAMAFESILEVLRNK